MSRNHGIVSEKKQGTESNLQVFVVSSISYYNSTLGRLFVEEVVRDEVISC